MAGPIKPHEVVAQKKQYLPEEVFQAFNQMIAQNWDGSQATFTQREILARLVEVVNMNRSEIYERRYLDVEPCYRAEGWEVEYDKPGYNETYEATFTFRKK